ncbi:uncharacterized protein [Rutidosis leptorrhynchoides]|uniref:uncharacterized protein n=1 Tax=Rutidosis leptorrhynchoides TaxID=125765 RepID=UPI003A996803
MEINEFTQRSDETLYNAWVRFKKMLRACPPHGLTKKEYINTFYRGTNSLTRQYLDSSSGEVFMYKSSNAAKTFLENISINTYKWTPSPRDLQRKSVSQIESDNGKVTLASLNNQFQMYGKELKRLQQSIVAMQVGCQRCEGPHLTKNCPQISQCNHIDLDDIPMNSDAHVNDVSNQNYQRGGTSNQGYYNPNQKRGLTTQGIEDPHPQPFITQEPLPSFVEEEIGVSKEKGKEKVESIKGMDNDETGKKRGDEPLKATRPVPYPKALRKDKLAAQYKKFQDMMKNVSVNLPITDVLKGMPNYGRFIKELISQRGKYHDETSFFIEEECNKIFASRPRIPKKLGDPGKFIFPCKLGDSEVFNALADLGASTNLMPHSL